jgi:hypothetical protein
MSRPEWEKKSTDEPIYEGVREAFLEDVTVMGLDIRFKIETIFEALDSQQLLVFYYDGSDRVVAPFVLGVSSEGNPLVRCYQLEGFSRSGKGEGWRVFQVVKIENLANHQEYFDPDEYDFDRDYPWIYKVIASL